MTASVTIHSDAASGATTVLRIDQTGPTTATLKVTSPSSPGGDTYQLEQIRADAAGLTVSCKAHYVLLVDIVIRIKRAALGQPPLAAITHPTLFGSTTDTFPLRAGEDQAVAQFLTQAKFPT